MAEEAQRLAEHSAEATKQIGALVKTIQGDTQDAIETMEKSTLGVVEGAKLSDVADKVAHAMHDTLQKRKYLDMDELRDWVVSRNLPADGGKVIAISKLKKRDLLNQIYSKFWT